METKGTYVQCAWRKMWIMWDLDNGHYFLNNGGKGYVWIFRTRDEAKEHKRKQRLIGGANLSKPIKIDFF